MLALAFVVSIPAVTVNAQSFYVTTNKDTYHEGERVVVIGQILDTEDRHPVVVTIASGEDECAKQNVRALRDGSFVSRSMAISGCAPGEFTVTAIHAGSTGSSSFVVEDEQDVSDSLELRAIRATVIQAQNIVNSKMREVVAAGLPISDQAAEAYGNGVSAASLALQAVERGDVREASEHRAEALKHFNDAFGLLSSERLSAIAEEAREEETRVSGAREWFGRLQDLLSRLVDLADKNSLEAYQEFNRIGDFLTEARQHIGERNVTSAEEALRSAEDLLEDVRKKLFQQAEPEDSERESLTSAVERIENSAQMLREDARGQPRALAQVNASYVFINNAKSAIDDGRYDAAKRSLELALEKLDRARTMIENNR